MPLFPLAENAFYTQNLLAVNSLLMLTLVFKFLELSPKLNVLTQTLVHAGGEMFWFMLLFFNLLLSYCMAFYLHTRTVNSRPLGLWRGLLRPGLLRPGASRAAFHARRSLASQPHLLAHLPTARPRRNAVLRTPRLPNHHHKCLAYGMRLTSLHLTSIHLYFSQLLRDGRGRVLFHHRNSVRSSHQPRPTHSPACRLPIARPLPARRPPIAKALALRSPCRTDRFSLISVLLGAFNFEKLVEYNAFVGPFLYWTYVLVMFFFILSSFVAIIEEAFSKAKEMGKTKNDRLADEFETKVRDRLRVARRLEKRLQRYAQRTRSTKMMGAKFSLRARENYSFGNLPTSRLAQMTDAVKNVLGRARLPSQGARPEAERIRRVAWAELHIRHKATHELMAHLHKARRQQGALLEKVAHQKKQQMVQLEELSTQLWNCWQLVSDAKRKPRPPKTEEQLERARKAAAEKDLSKQGLAELPASVLSLMVTQIEASDNQIEEITVDIAAAANLEELLLYKNKVKTVDPAIGQLQKLKVLNLFNQGVLTKLPWAELGGLGALEELNLAANKIMVIPDTAFAGLSSLRILSINDNRLVRLGSLKPLTRLEELRVYNNNLEEMPTIGLMRSLTVLELNKNRIDAIASDYFANTPAVEKLIISGNLLEAVPASLATCASLQFLQLQDNRLRAFEDAAWGELARLETIFLQGNLGLVVPASLGQCAGLKRINVPTAPDALATSFKKCAMATPGGKYWDRNGKAFESPFEARGSIQSRRPLPTSK